MNEEQIYFETYLKIAINHKSSLYQIELTLNQQKSFLQGIDKTKLSVNQLEECRRYINNLKNVRDLLNNLKNSISSEKQLIHDFTKYGVKYVPKPELVNSFVRSYAKFQLQAQRFTQFIQNNKKYMGAATLGLLTSAKNSPLTYALVEGTKSLAKSTISTAGKAGLIFIAAPTVVTGGHWLSYKARYPNEKIMSPVLWEKVDDSWVLSPRKGDLRASKQVKTRSFKDNKQFFGLERSVLTSCLNGKRNRVMLPVWRDKKELKEANTNIAKMFHKKENDLSFIKIDKILSSISP